MVPIGRSFPAFVLVASIGVLGIVLASQYWGGLAPCELCLKERWPWAAAIAIAAVATASGSERALPRVTLLLVVVFAISSGLAFYHVGVEQHWFAGPAACSARAAPDTLAALEAQLLRQPPVRCDQPAWTLWGLSLAGWNLLASLAMAGISLAALRQWRRPPRSAR